MSHGCGQFEWMLWQEEQTRVGIRSAKGNHTERRNPQRLELPSLCHVSDYRSDPQYNTVHSAAWQAALFPLLFRMKSDRKAVCWRILEGRCSSGGLSQITALSGILLMLSSGSFRGKKRECFLIILFLGSCLFGHAALRGHSAEHKTLIKISDSSDVCMRVIFFSDFNSKSIPDIFYELRIFKLNWARGVVIKQQQTHNFTVRALAFPNDIWAGV